MGIFSNKSERIELLKQEIDLLKERCGQLEMNMQSLRGHVNRRVGIEDSKGSVTKEELEQVKAFLSQMGYFPR